MRVAEYIFGKLWWYLFENDDYSDAWEEIVCEYESEGRHYHNLDHIEEMVIYLWEADWPTGVAATREKFTAIAAAFFHDFENPRHKWAEEMSGAWLRLNILAWSQNNPPANIEAFWYVINHGDKAVCDTTSHRSVTLVGQMLIDADLRRFVTGPWQRWDRQIREEYSEHSDEDFNKGRLVVLRHFRERSPFFYLAQHDDCEAYRRIDEQIAELDNSSD